MSLEQALLFSEEPKANWHRILPLQLTGKAKAALDVNIRGPKDARVKSYKLKLERPLEV